ncbi:MAG: class I SAM-dependent methyltransferase [Nitrosomonas sp.]|nr:class I SAM-dependent methyltransferase [Nitrosomonas sp.]MDP1950262.1 class I SAM-dependent methyltransferase [Nitrosomonas sp.]
MSDYPVISWNEAGEEKSARWRAENSAPPPKQVVIADDRMTADAAYRLACEGNALLWRGDFQNARHLLQAMARRIDKKPRQRKTRKMATAPTPTPVEAFHRHRLAQSQRARTLSLLLLPFEAGHRIPLRRAPDVHSACLEAYGAGTEPYIASLRELQGLIGAYEWRKKGVEVPALGARIHPYYGVFAPIRSEYVGLVAEAPLPELAMTQSSAFDIGTGTGVLAAVLARRGIQRIVATEQDLRALDCARENLTRLDLTAQVDLVQADLFPEGQASLIVCNPPWIPARPSSPLEYAVFDPESRMLRGFLSGLAAHLAPGGEGWLILSDLAEHLELRTRAELLAAIDAAGLKVLSKSDVKPHHPRVSDTRDPLHAARAAELTSLWRLIAT